MFHVKQFVAKLDTKWYKWHTVTKLQYVVRRNEKENKQRTNVYLNGE